MATKRVTALARRIEGDDFFLASALADYARTENLDEQGLAGALGCSEEDLVSLRLCRRPRPQPESFRREVGRIASRFGARTDILAEAIRRSDALRTMSARSTEETSGTLMAARDCCRGSSEGDES
jgi:hypothetical protein